MKNKIYLFLILIFYILTACNNVNYQKSIEDGNFRIYVFDVGQGESILMEYNDDCILIDAGSNSNEKRVVQYLNKLNINKINYAIATHPDADHIGGMESVIKNIHVDNFIMTEDEKDTDTYRDVLDVLESENINIIVPKENMNISLRDIDIDVIIPNDKYDGYNNNSIVVKATYGEFKILFTGDMEKEEEEDLILQRIYLKSDILKVGHHGSKTSTSDEFLRIVDPDYAIISVGEDNKYGHPHKEVIKKLEDNNIEIYRTDKDGTIFIETDGSNINIFTDDKKDKENYKEYNGENWFIGNKNSKIYHKPSCRSLPKEENIVFLSSKSEAKSKRFKPCGTCKP